MEKVKRTTKLCDLVCITLKGFRKQNMRFLYKGYSTLYIILTGTGANVRALSQQVFVRIIEVLIERAPKPVDRHLSQCQGSEPLYV